MSADGVTWPALGAPHDPYTCAYCGANGYDRADCPACAGTGCAACEGHGFVGDAWS